MTRHLAIAAVALIPILLADAKPAAAERLVTAALMAKVTDNVTAVTIDFTASGSVG